MVNSKLMNEGKVFVDTITAMAIILSDIGLAILLWPQFKIGNNAFKATALVLFSIIMWSGISGLLFD